MGRPILVDSSWYIRQMRAGHDPLRALAFIAETRDIAVCGMIKAEVGRGLKIPRILERYQLAWSVMLYIESDLKRWDETLKLAWQLDRSGMVLPIQDVHIAACAIHAGAVVLTYDAHFDRIPGIDATDRIL
ncbi:MAG: PIN domain-containing protein [Verrucomicrobiota bacterium]